MNIVATKMGSEHVDAVMEIENRSFPSPWKRESFLSDINASYASDLVAVRMQDDHVVLGYIAAWIVYDECMINKIASHPDYRNRGVGTLLLKTLIEKAGAEGVSGFYLEARQSNITAIRFYESFGFGIQGKRKNYYSDTGEDAVVMNLTTRIKVRLKQSGE